MWSKIRILAVLALMSVAVSDVQAQHFYYDLHGDTVFVTPADSVILIAFKPGGLSGIHDARLFAAQVAGLSDTYPVWEWSDGFFVFGVDYSVSFESA
jgi:hypothetical protein